MCCEYENEASEFPKRLVVSFVKRSWREREREDRERERRGIMEEIGEVRD